MGILVIGPADGEQPLGGPIRARIIEDGSHTGHRLGLLEATLPPGSPQPPQHVHREHDEVFIVTAGKVRFTSGTDSVDIEPGTVVVVPIGEPHTFSNPFNEQAVFIGTITPDRYIQYFRDIGQLPADQHGLPEPSAVARTMARYATEVVPPE
jgi:mannose-6-phosphate isomerase-like protein (cupin superfamily)